MNRTVIFIILLLITFVINIFQSSIISPSSVSFWKPDLNLIFVILIGISQNVLGGTVLVVINGLIMDVMSGHMIGVHTLSRLSLYIFLKSSSNQFNFENFAPKTLALFFGTIFVWLFIWLIFRLRDINEFKITMDVIVHQATINTLIGGLVVFALNRINARI